MSSRWRRKGLAWSLEKPIFAAYVIKNIISFQWEMPCPEGMASACAFEVGLRAVRILSFCLRCGALKIFDFRLLFDGVPQNPLFNPNFGAFH